MKPLLRGSETALAGEASGLAPVHEGAHGAENGRGARATADDVAAAATRLNAVGLGAVGRTGVVHKSLLAR